MRSVMVWLTVATTAFAVAPFVQAQPAAPQPGALTPRVIRGDPVPATDLQALGLVDVNGGSCSGALLTNEWVITAAHCLSALQTMNPGSVTVRARWGGGQVRNATQIYRSWELKANDDPERANLADIAFIRVAPITVNGSNAGYQRQLSSRGPQQMVGRTITVYGQGMEREAFIQNGVAMPGVFNNTFRRGTFTVGGVRDDRFWFSPNAAGQMVGGGDSGGPSFDGSQLAGVHSQCRTRCLRGQTCAGGSWMWISRVLECGDAPAVFGSGPFAAMRRDPPWDPTRAYQDIVTTEFAPNVPSAQNSHERTVWPVVQSAMFRFCERRGFVAALARYGAATSPNVLCLGARAARVIRLPAGEVRSLTGGATDDLLSLSFGRAASVATRYCASRILGSIGGFAGGVVHSSGAQRTYDAVCLLDSQGDRKITPALAVAEHATLAHAEFRRRGDDACRARGYGLGGFVTGVPSGSDTTMACFGPQDATAALIEQGGGFGVGLPPEVLRARRAFYAVSLDEPLIAPEGAAIDVQLQFRQCHDPIVLSVTSGCPVEPALEQWSYNPQTQQIVHLDSGRCLNVSGASGSPDAWVILYPCTGRAANERWTVSYPGTSSVWTIRSAASGLCLHAKPGGRVGRTGGILVGLQQPAVLTQMPCNGSSAQQFDDVDRDWYRRNGPR